MRPDLEAMAERAARREAARLEAIRARLATRQVGAQPVTAPPPPPPPAPMDQQRPFSPFSAPTRPQEIAARRRYATAISAYLSAGMAPAEAAERAKADAYAQAKTPDPPTHGTPIFEEAIRTGFCSPSPATRNSR